MVLGAPHLALEDAPPEVRLWPAWRMAIWVAMAEGRRPDEQAAAATLAAERAGEAPDVCGEAGLPVTKRQVWRVTRDPRFIAIFRPLLDDRWLPLAEPAMDLLGKLVEEGTAEHATPEMKSRSLAAAKEILRIAVPSRLEGHAGVQVNVSGGAQIAVGLGDLLRAREPFRPPALVAGPVVVDAEVDAVPTADVAQPRRSRTSSQRTAEQRSRMREQTGG